MSQPAPALASKLAGDHVLGRLVDELTAKLQAGEAVDIDAYVDAHPEHAEQLKLLLPALKVLADLGKSGAALATAPLEGTQDEILGTLGDFRILREVGRGGMGVVYEAEQISLGRRVALKVLPFASALDPKQLQRFRNEAHAAANLHHTNIVPVYGVGCARNVHYFAMQYVEGMTLAALIRELRREHGKDQDEAKIEIERTKSVPRESRTQDYDAGYQEGGQRTRGPHDETFLSDFRSSSHSTRLGYFHSAARLIIQAAEALEHAHLMGVIHRDIKPGNLLISSGGDVSSGAPFHVWVSDFGLAQTHGDVQLTLSGDLLGTLRYMSPEQALAKRVIIDHRTDIYSLGVTLYELLTLEPAYTGRDRQEVFRQIAFEEPRPPTRVNKSVPVELETITLKAIAKNPAERYATAQEFADDLKRFLDDKPLLARRPSLMQRLRKWSRRHPSVVVSSLLALFLVIVALTTGTVLLSQQRNEAQLQRDEAQRQRDETKRQRDLAQANFHKAREAVDTYFTRVSEEQLLNEPGMQPLRKRLLQSALQYYQGFVQQSADDLSLQQDLAQAYLRVGVLTGEVVSRVEAQKPLQEAIRLFEALRDKAPDDADIQFHLARGYKELAYVQVFGGQFDRIEESANKAIAILERLRLSGDRALESERVRGRCYDLIGTARVYKTRFADAISSFDKAVAILAKVAQASPGDIDAKRLLTTAYNNSALAFQGTGRWIEEEKALDQAVANYRAIFNLNPASARSRRDLGLALGHLGTRRYDLGRLTSAAASQQEAYQLLKKLVDENPSVTDYMRLLAMTTGRAAEVKLAQGQPASARQHLHEAIALDEKLIGMEPANDHPYLDEAWWLYRLACVEAELGKPALALEQSTKALSIQEKLIAKHPDFTNYLSDCLWSREQIGLLRVELEQTSASSQIAAQAQILEQRQKLAREAPNNPQWQYEWADALVRLGQLRGQAGLPNAALEAVEQALPILEKLVHNHAENLEYQRFRIHALAEKSRAQNRLNQSGAARESARQAATLAESLAGQENAYLYDLACHRALCCALIGVSKKPSSSEEAEARRYADASMEALRQVSAAGFDNVHKLKTEPCLSPLRSRPDFQKLIQELETRTRRQQ